MPLMVLTFVTDTHKATVLLLVRVDGTHRTQDSSFKHLSKYLQTTFKVKMVNIVEDCDKYVTAHCHLTKYKTWSSEVSAADLNFWHRKK